MYRRLTPQMLYNMSNMDPANPHACRRKYNLNLHVLHVILHFVPPYAKATHLKVHGYLYGGCKSPETLEHARTKVILITTPHITPHEQVVQE